MGRVSEELKSLKKIEEQKLKSLSMAERKLEKHKKKVEKKRPAFPAKGRDYHWMEVAGPNTAPAGWILRLNSYKHLGRSDIKYYLEMRESYPLMPSQKVLVNRKFFFLYPGEAPDPKWGELCP